MQTSLFDSGKHAGAILSADRRYRYLLTREWDPTRPKFGFLCLNPSTADESIDDPTVKRCMRFAENWGGGGILISNLFAYRATDPVELLSAEDPVGPENDKWIEHAIQLASATVAAWGCNGTLLGRDAMVLARYADRLSCLRLTKDGHPGHPLYLPGSLRPIPLR
jgi:hypothetical protein